MLANADAVFPFCHPVCDDEHIGTLALNEEHYYQWFVRYSLSGIQETSREPGHRRLASQLYTEAFGKSVSVKLPRQCQPELATRVREPARAASAGAMAMEEQAVYIAIGMSDSYFPKALCKQHRLFYASPPIGCSTLGAGPMGMLFAVEWIGVVFLSIVSQPFYAGSPRNQEALAMFDQIEAARDVSISLSIPHDVKLFSNPREKKGVAWGVYNGAFIKSSRRHF